MRKPNLNFRHYSFITIFVLIFSSAGSFIIPNLAQAVSQPALVGGSNVSGKPTTSIAITDLSVTATGNPTVPVHLFVPSGYLSMTTTTGITFVNGISTGTNIYLSGSLTNVNAALASLHFEGNSLGVVKLEASIVDGGQVYYPGNGHLYEVVDNGSALSADDAKIAADARTLGGVPGYLATITSTAENDFVSSQLSGDGWFGASDAATEGDWKWIDGPETGTSFWLGEGGGSPVNSEYSHWSSGEPNDSGGDEDCAEFYSGINATWNDLPCSAGGLNYYVVEYGTNGNLPEVSSKSLNITLAADTVNVASCPELRAIGASPSTHTFDTINITHNLDCSGSDFPPMFNQTDVFKGVFNGNGHTISNLTINNPSDDFVGLIGYAEDATFNNIHLISGSVSGQYYVGGLLGDGQRVVINNSSSALSINATGTAGGLVGYLGENTSSITSSFSSGNVNGGGRAGGLAGYNDGTITSSYASGAVTGDFDLGGLVGQNDYKIAKSFATGNVAGSVSAENVGGLAGRNTYYGDISESYATGNAEAYRKVGGLLGASGGKVANAYARGTATGNSQVGSVDGRCGSAGGQTDNVYGTGLVTAVSASGGVIGTSDGCVANNSFWDKQTTGKNSSSVGTGKTTVEMKTQSTFTNATWNFSTIWAIDGSNDGYPVLIRAQYVAPTIDNDGDGQDGTIEDAGPNSGDANNDGTADSAQGNVTSLVDQVTGNYTVLQSTCTANSDVSVSPESTNFKDSGFDYPAGLLNFNLDCGTPNTTATVTEYFYGSFDPAKLSLRKHNPNSKGYTTISGAVLSSMSISGQPVLKVVYTITDGGALDQDNTANGTIVDPSGPALNVVGAPNTGLGRQSR